MSEVAFSVTVIAVRAMWAQSELATEGALEDEDFDDLKFFIACLAIRVVWPMYLAV